MSFDEADENIPPPPTLKNDAEMMLDPSEQPTTSAYASDESQTPTFEHKFSWPEFMKVCASLPATCSRLAAHAEHLEKTLAEVIFSPGTQVMVGHSADMIPAVMKSLVGDIAYVEFYDENSSVEVKVDQLVLAVTPMPLSGWAKDNIAGIPHAQMERLDQKVVDFIQPGHFFEYIDPQNPQTARIVKIIDNRNGFVRGVDASGKQVRTFLSWERCKRIGFSLMTDNEGEFRLEPFPGATIKTTTPWYVFCRSNFRKHSMEVGHIVEVIDPFTRFRILPGVVVEIINRYFYRVQVFLPPDLKDHEPCFMTFHKGSADVFPANFASKHGMRLTAPAGHDEASFTIYKIKGRPATDTQFDIPKNVERFETGRHVEVFDEQQEVFVPATIIRQHRHLLVLRYEHDAAMSLPRLFSYYDERIFKCGASEYYGRPLAKTVSQFQPWHEDIQLKLTSKVLEAENSTRFMLKAFADAKQFIPRLYVNFDCYKGPFLHAQKALHLDSSFPPSPFQPLMYQIINDMLEVLSKTEYQKLCEASVHTRAPTFSIKLIHPKSDVRSRVFEVEVCETAAEFSGWLRQFLLKYDICPNFISALKLAPGQLCPYHCEQISHLPQTKNGIHLNIPNAVSKTDEMRARRMNLQTNVNANPRKRENPDKQIQKTAAEFTDLDQPLPLRRTRRNIIPTKRKEMQDEMADNLKQYFKEKRKREASSANSDEPLKRRSKNGRILPDQRKADSQPPQNDLIEMADKIDLKRLAPEQAIRLNPTGPRVLMPKGHSASSSTSPPSLSRSPSVMSKLPSPEGRVSPTEHQKICQKLGIGENEEPREWTTQRLVQVVRKAKLDAVADFLENEEFDGESFFLLSEEDFKDRVQLKTGPLIKTMRLLADLKALSPDMPNLGSS
ncbi:unnamed protein product [Bursaphelenchus okinawaensis]|uniref:SLED domain-containing protein n=1 Tax=Bursaphelenchus okinawaensis TaxID=465554 RepID=A0A811L4U0_9BILA|nr:unnamed protein product [Bursaphelenchus okinawaensis]CAG9117278.1 unnamed protein product [Bursaphelenchus okinawaensis]